MPLPLGDKDNMCYLLCESNNRKLRQNSLPFVPQDQSLQGNHILSQNAPKHGICPEWFCFLEEDII